MDILREDVSRNAISMSGSISAASDTTLAAA